MRHRYSNLTVSKTYGQDIPLKKPVEMLSRQILLSHWRSSAAAFKPLWMKAALP